MENNHSVSIDNREKITITAVTDIASVNEESVAITLAQGGLIIRGKGLRMKSLDSSDGIAVITGEVLSLVYTSKKIRENSSWLGKALK